MSCPNGDGGGDTGDSSPSEVDSSLNDMDSSQEPAASLSRNLAVQMVREYKNDYLLEGKTTEEMCAQLPLSNFDLTIAAPTLEEAEMTVFWAVSDNLISGWKQHPHAPDILANGTIFYQELFRAALEWHPTMPKLICTFVVVLTGSVSDQAAIMDYYLSLFLQRARPPPPTKSPAGPELMKALRTRDHIKKEMDNARASGCDAQQRAMWIPVDRLPKDQIKQLEDLTMCEADDIVQLVMELGYKVLRVEKWHCICAPPKTATGSKPPP
ncbi:hypothetical protein BOTBODRAFT_181660 [Botryobasidium botryosum FD-172 SS1]|uniref:Uncharacterized protein n=1 Tax=Botryobasidium botryosum (strain FD-172 SS1) TaxID=930990 RepID=A0A067LTJ3_BOTB1|nr:hypothetical protein BOTBODRAFT_181660 [Botryobasidium botryosum FD-172 SS1]